MRAVWQALAFLLAVVVIFLIIKLPAKFIYQQFVPDNTIRLVGISGSIWSGHVEKIDAQQITLQNLDWELSPFSLLLGEAFITWQLNDPVATLSGELTLSKNNISLANTHGNINLIGLAQRLPRQEVLLAGDIDTNIELISLDQQQISKAVGELVWQQAGLVSPENIAFGQFKAVLSSEAGKLIVQFSDIDGAVSLAGDMTVTRFGAFQYSMKLGVRDTSIPGLIKGFNQLGQPDSEGKIKIRGSGNFLN